MALLASLETVHPRWRFSLVSLRAFPTGEQECHGNETYLIVSLPIPSSISISMIFWRWSPCSWMTAGGEAERVSRRRVVEAKE